MKKKITLMVSCCMAFCMAACGTGGGKEGAPETDADPAAGTAQTITITDADTITEEQALTAIKNYCHINNPDLADMEDSDEYTIFWDVATNDAGETVVLYRSYTGAEIRYYIDPASGEVYVTELVPGIIDDEQRTEESFNIKDYLTETSAEPAETGYRTGRQDGERFEDVIMLEGMEETVSYEHVRNENAGFELDYDYESLKRSSGSDSERFISLYDDENDPVNCLEVSCGTENAETVLAEMTESLSHDFDTVTTEQQELDGAGQCVCIFASDAKSGRVPAGAMQSVYIIPAGDGCVLAKACYTVESAEGFGARFSDIVHTIRPLND
ncbi:MAG: hypothetical protein K6G83_07845 [Lachnospiraceae bacterium]|nr:hypothetical protein [Lachnospiraceae bacterium]